MVTSLLEHQKQMLDAQNKALLNIPKNLKLLSESRVAEEYQYQQLLEREKEQYREQLAEMGESKNIEVRHLQAQYDYWL